MRSLINRLFGSAVVWSGASSTARRAGEARGNASPAFESLESRQMLAVVVWDGGPTGTATDFNTAANWVGDVLPGPADTAVINTAGSTITFSSGTRTITNLETSRDMQFSGGSLVTSGTNTITAVLRMQGGTLNGGTWNLSGFGQFSFTTSGGTLANLTTTSELNIGVASGSITLSGTTTTGTIRLSGNNSNLNLAPGYTLNANVIAEGTGTSTRSITVASGGAGTVTISPSSTITLGVSSGSGLILQQSSVATLINNGLIVNENSSQTLTVSVPAFTNAGTLRATAGNLTVSSTGGWLNSGTIEAAAAGIVNLGGTFNASAGEGTFGTSAGVLNLTGTLTNTGNTFDLSPTTTGNLRIAGGTLNSGFVNATGGSVVAATGNGGTLSNVAITGEVLLSVSSAQLTLSGTTTFTALRMSGSNSLLLTTPGFVLSNPIIGEGAATGTREIYVAVGGNGTTTISSTGSITAATGLGADLVLRQSSTGTLINNGLIVNQAAGRTIQIVSLNTFTNAATGIVRATAGSVSFGATTWTNAGTIENAAGSNINLGGTFNATGGIGTFNTEPGNVLVTGTVNNTGNTITLNSTTGDWTMQGGTISGGSLILNAVPLNTTSTISTLSNVAITGEVLLSVSGARLILSGTTTFTTLRMVASNSAVYLAPGYVLSNPIIGEGAATGTREIYVAFDGNGTTTISSTGSITAATGLGADLVLRQSSTGTLINNGLIVNQAAGRTIQIVSLNTFTNAATGIVRATAGSVNINATTWTNAGTIENASGSTIALAGTFNATGGIGTFNTEPGNVLVTGTVNNTGNTITLNATTGDWTMQGGTISGGSLILNGVAMNTSTTGGTLANLAITGDVLMSVSSAQVTLSGTTSFTTLRMAAGNTTLYTAPGYVINNPIIGEGAATGTRNIYVAFGGNGTTTISSTGSITAATGLGADLVLRQSSTGTLINDGLIVNQATGRTLQITELNTFTNNANGIVRATAGSVNINATTWTNAGSLQVSNGAFLQLNGTWNTTAGEGTVANGGGTIYIDGNITNTGNTIELNSGTGSWIMRSGAINGGAMIFSNSSAVLGSTSIGILRNVAINGELNLNVVNTNLGIGGTTTFTAFRLSNSQVNLYVEPGTTIASPITAEGAATGVRAVIMNYGGSGAITIAPTGSIRTVAGLAGDLSISQSSASNVFNSGVISSEATGRTLTINGTNFTNSANGSINALAGTVRIQISSGFINLGTITAVGGAVASIDGIFNATGGIGTFNTAAGVVNLTGTVNNLGNTITTNAATGSFNIISATINDGSFVLLDGTTLNAPSGFSNISNLSVVGDVVASGSGSIRIVGTTSVTTLRLQGSSGAYFGPDMTLAFPIVVEGASTGGRSVAVAYGGSGGFTIGPSGSIRILAGSGGGLSISQSSLITSFVNNGLISSEAAGRTISISMPVFTNNATLRASGGTLDMGITAQFVNTSTIDLGPGGLIRFTSASGFANAATGTINVTLGGPANTQFGRLQSTSANITLDGTLNLTIPNNVTIPIVTRFDLITVPGNRTISGDFANITQPPPGPDGKNFFLVSPTVYSFAYSSLADFNSDAVVDLFDYLDFVAAFAAGDPTADFNNDAAIDFFDYLDFLVIFSRF